MIKVPLHVEQIEELMAQLDLDGDGEVDYE